MTVSIKYEDEYTVPYPYGADIAVYLNTFAEKLYIREYHGNFIPENEWNGIDFAWGVPTDILSEGYNELMNDIKRYATRIVESDDKYERLELVNEVQDIIDNFDFEPYEVMTLSPGDDLLTDYYPYTEVSPAGLRDIVSEGMINTDGNEPIYFPDSPSEYEESLMYSIAYHVESIVRNGTEQVSKFLQKIRNVYTKDGYASEFEKTLLPFLEEQYLIRNVNGKWYLNRTDEVLNL